MEVVRTEFLDDLFYLIRLAFFLLVYFLIFSFPPSLSHAIPPGPFPFPLPLPFLSQYDHTFPGRFHCGPSRLRSNSFPQSNFSPRPTCHNPFSSFLINATIARPFFPPSRCTFRSYH